MDKVKDVDIQERKLQEAEESVQDLFKAGKVPAPADYAAVDMIKAELKVARRVATRNAVRKAPTKTRRVTILVSAEEFEDLSGQAKSKGLGVSEYIRQF